MRGASQLARLARGVSVSGYKLGGSTYRSSYTPGRAIQQYRGIQSSCVLYQTPAIHSGMYNLAVYFFLKCLQFVMYRLLYIDPV